MAFYHRFGISADPEFVETRPGGGAVSAQLRDFASVTQLVQCLAAGS